MIVAAVIFRIYTIDLTFAVSKEHRAFEFLELSGGCVHSADAVF